MGSKVFWPWFAAILGVAMAGACKSESDSTCRRINPANFDPAENLSEPLALLTAEEVLYRDTHVIKREFAGLVALVPVLLDLPRDR